MILNSLMIHRIQVWDNAKWFEAGFEFWFPSEKKNYEHEASQRTYITNERKKKNQKEKYQIKTSTSNDRNREHEKYQLKFACWIYNKKNWTTANISSDWQKDQNCGITANRMMIESSEHWAGLIYGLYRADVLWFFDEKTERKFVVRVGIEPDYPRLLN